MAFERRILTTYDASTAGFDRGTARVEAGLRRLERSTNQRLTSIDQRFARSSRAALRLGTSLGAILGVAGGAAVIRGVREYAEAWRDVERSLTNAGFAVEGNREKIAQLAIRSRSDFASAGQAVARFSRITGDGVEANIRRVETLNKLLAIGGATTAERDSVTIQFSQALRSNRLQEQEFRSISEAAPVEFLEGLARAAGGTRETLKQLSTEGKITRDVMLAALDDMARVADEKFAKLAISGSEAAKILNTGFVAFFGRLDEQFGATAGLNEFLVDTGTFLANDAEAAATFAKALEVAAVAAASLAGGKALGAVNRSLAAGSALRKQAVADSARLIAASNAEVQKARELVVVRGQAFALAQRTATSAKQLETARNSLVAANARLTAAEARATAAANAHAIAQGRLSLATRATGAAMNFLSGTMTFFGGVPGLIFAAAAALVYFATSADDSAEKLAEMEGATDRLNGAVADLEQTQRAYTDAISATAGAQTSASSSIVADTKREFEAKKSLLELEVARQRALQAERRARIGAVESRLGEIPSSDAVRSNVLRGGVPGGRLSERDQQRVIDAEIERASRVAEVRNEIKKLSAEAELAAIAIERAEEALNSTFSDSGGGTGGGVSGGAGGGSRTKAERDAYAELIASAQERQQQLADEIALAGAAAEQTEFLAEKQRLLAEARQSGLEITAAQLAQIEQEARIHAELSGELEKVKAAKEIITAVTEKQATVEERIVAANEKLNALLPTIIALVGDEAEARRILAEAIEDSEKNIRDAADANDEWADSISNAIENAKSFEDALKSLGEELFRLAANDFFRSLFKSPNGGNSIFSQLGNSLGGYIGNLFGGGAAPTSSPLPVPKPMFHRGGVVGGPARMRHVSDAAFIGAPRYHSGGIAGLSPNEVPAILERGEIVVPKGAQLGGGGAQSITINQPVNITQPGASPAEIQAIVRASSDEAIKKITQRHARHPQFLQD